MLYKLYRLDGLAFRGHTDCREEAEGLTYTVGLTYIHEPARWREMKSTSPYRPGQGEVWRYWRLVQRCDRERRTSGINVVQSNPRRWRCLKDDGVAKGRKVIAYINVCDKERGRGCPSELQSFQTQPGPNCLLKRSRYPNLNWTWYFGTRFPRYYKKPQGPIRMIMRSELELFVTRPLSPLSF